MKAALLVTTALVSMIGVVFFLEACSSGDAPPAPTIEETASAAVEKDAPKKDKDPRHAAIIYCILKNTNEVCIHQMRGAKGNQVFVKKDGHQEAVYDADGNLVQDGINDGSYNYHHPQEEPLLHFMKDISPWIMWGCTREDPTTVKERIYAYMGDLEGGIRRAVQDKAVIQPYLDQEWSGGGQQEAITLFLIAIEKGGAEALFSLFDDNEELTDEKLIDVLTKLNKGFEAAYFVK